MTLEAHYVLDEDSGSTAYDYSGNENHGTANGAGPSGTGTVTGPFGNSAYDFDGAGDYVDSGISPENVDISHSFWVKFDTLGGVIFGVDDGTINFFAQTFDNSSDGDADDFRYRVFDGTNDIDLRINDVTELNEWTHFATTWDDSTGKGTVYKNGTEIGSSTNGSVGNIDSSTNYRLGQRSDGLSPMDSQLSDFRVYHRKLSPQEVQALYQAGERSEAVFAVTDSTAAAQSVSGGGGGGFYEDGGGSTGGGGGGTTY